MPMDDPRSDSALLEAWCAGELEAGAQLIDRKHSAIVRFFRNKVAVVDDEADLVQQTFAGLVEARTRIRGSGSGQVDAFLFAIARNVLRAYIRMRSKRLRESEDYGELCVGQLAAASPTSIAGLKRDARHLAECLRLVPLDDQIVLEMRFFEGATAQRIAELTGIARGSVDRRVRKGLERLGEVLRAQRRASGDDRPASTPDDLTRWMAEIRSMLPD